MQKTTNRRTIMSNTNFSQNRFRQTMIDNRRKVNEAMTQILTSGAPKLNSLGLGASDRNMKPRVMSLTATSFKMGDLTAKNTKF